MTPRWDAVVIGAGPAGCRTARDLCRRGYRVLVLEEHRQIGEPCHCSGLVTARTLAIAGEQDLILNKIRGATFHVAEESLRVTGPPESALAIDRVELDRRLARQALDSGATVWLGCRFAYYRLEGDARADGLIRVAFDEMGSRREVLARILLGADGALSAVARQMRGGRDGRLVRAMGAEAVYRGNALNDHVQVFLDESAAPGWFGWTIPLGPGLARVGTGTTNGIRPVESLTLLGKRFPEHFSGTRIVSRRAGFIPTWEPTSIVGDRLMLVGDAARQVKPTSGGGILTALLSAGLAADQASLALDDGNLSAQRLATYPRLWEESIGLELKRQHDMRRAFAKLDQAKLEKLITILKSPRVKRSVERSGDIDFPSRLVWRLLMLRPSLLLSAAVVPKFPLAWLGERRAEPRSPAG